MQKHNLKLIRGDDTSLIVRVDGYDLSGIDRVDLQVKVKNQTVISLSSRDHSIAIDGNRIILHFSHEMTQRARWTQGDYDLQLIKQSKIRTIMGGRIDLIHDITEV